MNLQTAIQVMFGFNRNAYGHARYGSPPYQEALGVLRDAPTLLEIQGPRGPAKVIGISPDGRELVYRDHLQDGGDDYGGCNFGRFRIGGFQSPVETILLGDGAPSQWIRGNVAGGCFALTKADAEMLGLLSGPKVRRDSPEVEAVFGSNVSTI